MTKEEKVEVLTKKMIETCAYVGVTPDETLEVLALATGNILTTIASMYGMHPKKMLEVYGKGIMEAEPKERTEGN